MHEPRAGVIGLDGELLGAARARYPLYLDEAAGVAEQDANDWWQALVAASRAALAEARSSRVEVAVAAAGRRA